MARPSDFDVSDELRESRAANGYKAEHRSPPLEMDLVNMRYYGGAEGNVLMYNPTLGLTPAVKPRPASKDEENVGEEGDEQGGGGGDGGGGDGVTIQLPPPGSSVAEVRPVGVSIAGVGGVAASKPTGTAVVGPGGLAIARPIATAIAGVPPDSILGPGPQGPGHQADMRTPEGAYGPIAVAVGPHKQPGSTYGVVPMARNLLRNAPSYVRFQPQTVLNSIQYSHQPVLLYPIAYY